MSHSPAMMYPPSQQGEGIKTAVTLQINTASVPPVPSARTPELYAELPPHGHASVAAVPALRIDLCHVEKHPRREGMYGVDVGGYVKTV